MLSGTVEEFVSVEFLWEPNHRQEEGIIYKRYSLVDGESVRIETMELKRHPAQFLPDIIATAIETTDDFLNDDHPPEAKEKLRDILQKKAASEK